MNVKIHKVVVVNGTKRGIVTAENESQFFVEPYPAHTPISGDAVADPDKVGAWRKKADVVPILEHLKSLKIRAGEKLNASGTRTDKYPVHVPIKKATNETTCPQPARTTPDPPQSCIYSEAADQKAVSRSLRQGRRNLRCFEGGGWGNVLN